MFTFREAILRSLRQTLSNIGHFTLDTVAFTNCFLIFIVRDNNWPPLPTWIPVQPCFYQDISVEIPVEFQKIVTLAYRLWMFHILVLLLNFIGKLHLDGDKAKSSSFGGICHCFGAVTGAPIVMEGRYTLSRNRHGRDIPYAILSWDHPLLITA